MINIDKQADAKRCTCTLRIVNIYIYIVYISNKYRE